MNKKIKTSFLKFVFEITGCFVVSCFCLFAQAKESYDINFSVQNSDLLKAELYRPIKLQNNKVFFPGKNTYGVIFDSKEGTFKKIPSCKKLKNIGNGILLSDGKVLFVAPLIESPIQKYKFEILDKYGNFEKDAWAKFRLRSEYENESKYLSYINKDPEFLKEYKKYAIDYQKSMYAQVFDPVTETFEYTGKINIRRANFSKILLNDGRVLITGDYAKRNPELLPSEDDKTAKDDAGKFEIYDPKTGKFELLSDVRSENWSSSSPVFILKNGNVYNANGEIFNPYTKTVSKATKLEGKNFTQLSDGRILFIGWDKKSDNTSIKIYDPNQDTISKIGELLIPRGEYGGSLATMKNDIVLIFGGINNERSNPFVGTVYENRFEIINPNTKQQKILSKRYKGHLYENILLDDGRLFLTTTDKTKIILLTLSL